VRKTLTKRRRRNNRHCDEHAPGRQPGNCNLRNPKQDKTEHRGERGRGNPSPLSFGSNSSTTRLLAIPYELLAEHDTRFARKKRDFYYLPVLRPSSTASLVRLPARIFHLTFRTWREPGSLRVGTGTLLHRWRRTVFGPPGKCDLADCGRLRDVNVLDETASRIRDGRQKYAKKSLRCERENWIHRCSSCSTGSSQGGMARSKARGVDTPIAGRVDSPSDHRFFLANRRKGLACSYAPAAPPRGFFNFFAKIPLPELAAKLIDESSSKGFAAQRK